MIRHSYSQTRENKWFFSCQSPCGQKYKNIVSMQRKIDIYVFLFIDFRFFFILDIHFSSWLFYSSPIVGKIGDSMPATRRLLLPFFCIRHTEDFITHPRKLISINECWPSKYKNIGQKSTKEVLVDEIEGYFI